MYNIQINSKLQPFPFGQTLIPNDSTHKHTRTMVQFPCPWAYYVAINDCKVLIWIQHNSYGCSTTLQYIHASKYTVWYTLVTYNRFNAPSVSTHRVFASWEMWTVEGQPWMYTVQLVRWVKSRSTPFTLPAGIRSTCPSWSANPHSGITGNFGTLLTDDEPSVAPVPMGPSVASAWGSTGPVFCLTEKANFFDGASSSLHRAKCVNKDCSCYNGKNSCMNPTEIKSIRLCCCMADETIRNILFCSLGSVIQIMVVTQTIISNAICNVFHL